MILDNRKTILLVMLAHVGVLHAVMTSSPPKTTEAEPIVMLAMPVAMGERAPEVAPAKPVVKVKQKVQQVKQKVQERRMAKSAPVAPKQEATPERVSTMEVAAVEKPQIAPAKDEGQGATSTKVVAATTGGGAQGQSTERNEAPTEPSFHANYLNNPKPRYPLQSRELGEKGVVYLRVAVNQQGLVDQVELHKSSGFLRLDQEAQNTVQRWRFVPAKRGDVAVAGTVIVPVVFSIKSS
ncbi:energy transducer TonB [Deefgea tanakiae]|jgi:protein TonB|uniref:Energy transducer TonB n=1 Tax=Deefgea tanakiae TaxID=2865840 RepID=A0ABX8Z1X3_9NEIS|nr:energy transducer TonB [Deefgea tanakiae]QZA76581.1 energy transducer TonB [Deefgea tanakiae]